MFRAASSLSPPQTPAQSYKHSFIVPACETDTVFLTFHRPRAEHQIPTKTQRSHAGLGWDKKPQQRWTFCKSKQSGRPSLSMEETKKCLEDELPPTKTSTIHRLKLPPHSRWSWLPSPVATDLSGSFLNTAKWDDCTIPSLPWARWTLSLSLSLFLIIVSNRGDRSW